MTDIDEAELQSLIPADWRTGTAGLVAPADWDALASTLAATNEADVFPPRTQWFRALRETPLASVRAVILGQDPYPKPGDAEGLAFSVPDERRAPLSLKRILCEAGRVASIALGRHSLAPWASRGVLLLNTALTVPSGHPAGHAPPWQPITEAFLRAVAGLPGPVLFMAWGRHAERALHRAGIADGQPHLVCPNVHPAERTGAFVGSDPFGRANEWLVASDLPRIDWSLS